MDKKFEDCESVFCRILNDLMPWEGYDDAFRDAMKIMISSRLRIEVKLKTKNGSEKIKYKIFEVDNDSLIKKGSFYYSNGGYGIPEEMAKILKSLQKKAP